MTMERIGEMGARTSSIGSKFDSGTYWWCKRTENWGTEPHSALTVILLWTLVLKFHYQNYLCMENHDPYLRLYVSRTEWRKRSYLGSLPFIGENELTNQHRYCSDPSVSIPPHLQAETKGLIVSDWIPLFGVRIVNGSTTVIPSSITTVVIWKAWKRDRLCGFRRLLTILLGSRLTSNKAWRKNRSIFWFITILRGVANT